MLLLGGNGCDEILRWLSGHPAISHSVRDREREEHFVDPLIPSMDLVLSVNTTYLACIVVVLLFVIYKLSVNPKMWFLPRHHFGWFQPHCGLPSGTLFLPGLTRLSPVSPLELETLWYLRYTHGACFLALSLDWTHSSCMSHFLNPDKTGSTTVSLELPLTSSLSQSHIYRIMDPEYWGGCSSADDGNRVMHLGVNRPCSHIGLQQRNNNRILL